MKKKLLNQRGFSLIELMIVVAIIGVLSAIAVPNFNRFQRKARQSEAKSAMGGAYTAQKAFRAEWETYSGDLVSTGYSVDGTLRYDGGYAGVGGDATLLGYVTGPKPGIFDIRALCSNATYGTQCVMHGVAPTFSSATTVAKDTFTFHIQGEIGGAVEDEWKVNEIKNMANVVDGVSGT